MFTLFKEMKDEVAQLKLMEDKIKACVKVANEADNPNKTIPLHLSSCLYYQERVNRDMMVAQYTPYKKDVEAFSKLFPADYEEKIESVQNGERKNKP